MHFKTVGYIWPQSLTVNVLYRMTHSAGSILPLLELHCMLCISGLPSCELHPAISGSLVNYNRLDHDGSMTVVTHIVQIIPAAASRYDICTPVSTL